MKNPTVAAMSVAVLLLASACGSGSGDDSSVPEAGHSAGGEDHHHGPVPEAYQGPVSSNDAARGAEVYEMACAGCHSGGAPALANIGWTPGQVRRQVREGDGGMPPFPASRLPDADLEAILAHMVTFGGVTPE